MREPTAAGMGRRRFLAGTGAAAVAGGVAWVAAWPSPVGAATVSLVSGAGNGTANRTALAGAIAGLAAGEVLTLPAGTYEVDISTGSVMLPRSITIEGAGRGDTVLDVVPKMPSSALAPLFDVPISAPDGSAFCLRDLTVHGPTTGVNIGVSCAIRWGRRGSTGRLRAERLTITGLFDSGVQRSGKGLFEVIDCDINAYEAPVKAFESSDSLHEAECVVLRGTHTSVDGKPNSGGIYIHPNVALLCAGVHYRDFGRFAIYANGTPGNPPAYFTVADTEVENCSLAQTATDGDAVFVRVKHHGVSATGVETTLRGNVTFVECDLRPSAQYGLLQGAHTIQMLSCWIEPQGIFLSAGVNTSGTFRFVDCTWKLTGNGRALNLTPGWTGRTAFLDSAVFDCGTTGPYLVQLNGGTAEMASLVVDSPRAGHGLTVGSSATVVSPPVLVSTGTCPTSPA